MSICPKNKSSKARRDKRRANWKMSAMNLVKCSKCGALMMPHRVCKACGSYNKKEIKKYETEQESEKYRREPDHRGCDLEAASDILFSDLVWNSVPADLQYCRYSCSRPLCGKRSIGSSRRLIQYDRESHRRFFCRFMFRCVCSDFSVLRSERPQKP